MDRDRLQAGHDGIRLEQQVLITEGGAELLSSSRSESDVQGAGSGMLESADQPAMPSQINFSPVIATKA